MAAGSIQSFQKRTNDKNTALIPVISTKAKRSGEISPSDGTGGITAGDLSTQSIMGAFSICPIPTRSPARDDGVGERPSRHFDRSEAEWRNLTPLMTEKLPAPSVISTEALRSGEISFL